MSKSSQWKNDDKQKSNQDEMMNYTNQDSNFGGDVVYDGVFDIEETASAAIDSPEMLRGPTTSSSAAVANRPNATVTLEDFELLKVLGKGAFAKVFCVRKKTGSDTGAIYALKVIKKEIVVKKAKYIEHTLSERKILETVKSPFICEMFYAFQTGGKLYMVLECMAGELFSRMKDCAVMNGQEARFYIVEVLIGLEYLHQHNIIHRDIKGENVMLDSTGHVKLADFNLGKMLDGTGKTSSFAGTLDFMAPEVCLKANYGKAADWWSVGALLYDMVVGCPPFTNISDRKLKMKKIVRDTVVPPTNLPIEVSSLILGLMTRNKETRLGAGGADEVKAHQFFNRVNWEDAYARRLSPPFRMNSTDVETFVYFDSKFTAEAPVDLPCDDIPHDLDTPFRGFSYVAPSVPSLTGEGLSSTGSNITGSINGNQPSTSTCQN